MDPLGVGHPRLRAPGPDPAWWPQFLLSPLARFQPSLLLRPLLWPPQPGSPLPSDTPPNTERGIIVRRQPGASHSDDEQAPELVSGMPSHFGAASGPPGREGHPQTVVLLSRIQVQRPQHPVTWTSPHGPNQGFHAICPSGQSGETLSPFLSIFSFLS